MYTHKYLRPHHSWFILLSDNNNNIIQRIMLLADRLSSCKFHSCARYLDMYMCSACSSKHLSKKCVCAVCTSASECACISLTHLISIHVWATFIPLSQWGLINIIIFFICVINSDFLTLFQSKNFFVFCTKKLTRSEMLIIILIKEIHI